MFKRRNFQISKIKILLNKKLINSIKNIKTIIDKDILKIFFMSIKKKFGLMIDTIQEV